MRILHLEDNPGDAELIRELLLNEWPDCAITLTATRAEFVAQLDSQSYDAILSDFSLASFNGVEALKIAQERVPATPFIFVTGTMGEERAIDALHHGAADYILKDKMMRLNTALRRALNEARERRQRQDAEAALLRFAAILEGTPDFVGMAALDGHIFYVNRAGLKMVNLPESQDPGLLTISDFHPPEEALILTRTSIPAALSEGVWSGESVLRARDGRRIPVSQVIIAHKAPDGRVEYLSTVMRDLTARNDAERLLDGQKKVLEMSTSGAPLENTLTALLCLIEAQSPGIFSSILLLDADGVHLRHGAAPSLPAAYSDAIDGIAIGPNVGSCGTAVYRRESVIVADIATDPLWQDFRELALSHGLRSCWSTPITNAQGHVLGTFAIYYEQPGHPTPRHLDLIEIGTQVAAVCISRAQAEEALRLSEENYRTLFEQANDGIFLANASGLLLDANLRGCQLFGCELDTVLGSRIADHVVPADQARAVAFLSDVPATAQVGHYRFRRGDGTEFPGETSVKRLPDGRLLGIVRDITERHAAEERIRQQADLLNQARDAIIVTDLKSCITFWNQGATRISGWTSEEVIGQRIEALLGTDFAEKIAATREAITSSEEWRGEIKLPSKQGTPLVLDLRIALVRDKTGQPVARLSIGTDITEKKKMEDQFLRAQRLESVGMLAAGIAHDLNNVLAPILMAAPMLREHATDPGDLRMLGMLERSAERGAGLVRQILGFAHGIGGEPKLFQVKHLLRDVIGVITETFPKNIRLEEYVPPNLWPIVANPTQIHQVLINLCVNARDAMPQGGTLRLRGENCALDERAAAVIEGARPGAWLVLHVEDTGTGIPPETLARIWEPFFTTKEMGKGTGLGLSTVRGIVNTHLGFVSLQTTPGAGTTFRVYLPAAEGSTEGETVAAERAPRGNGELILIVDDEIHIRDLTVTTLSRYGYRVLAASDGTDAVALFAPRSQEIGLVITDLNMPNLDGQALACVLQRLNPDVKLLAMSGLTSSSHDTPTAASFAHAFLPKPFKTGALLTTVYRLLHP